MHTFQHPGTRSTHTACTCRSRFYKQSTHRRCKSRHLRSRRVPQGGHAVTCGLLIRAEGACYARIKPPSMHAPSVQPACGRLEVEPRAAAHSARTAVGESRGYDASARALPLPTLIARSPPTSCSVQNSCRCCRWPVTSCSHHLRANLPNAGIVRGGEHGSFTRGDEASSSMKGCSLCM